MKKILFVLMFGLLSSSAMAQGFIGLQYVFDPQQFEESVKNTKQIGTLISENKKIVKLKEAYKELRKNASWVQKLRSIKMAIDMLESTVCTSQDLDASMASAGVLDNCMFSFEHYNATMQLATAADMLNFLLSPTEQDPDARLAAAQRAMDIMADAHRQMMALKKRSDAITEKRLDEIYQKQARYNFLARYMGAKNKLR